MFATLSSSAKAVSFSSARTTKRFPSSRCASATKSVRPLASTPETQPQLQPALPRFSATISQILHARRRSDNLSRMCQDPRARRRFQSVVSFYSHHIALFARTISHDSAFTGRFARDASRIRRNNSIHISLGCYYAMKIYDDELLEVLRALRQTYSDSRQPN